MTRNAIAGRAMLVSLNLRAWTGVVKEKKIVAEAVKAHGAAEGSVKGRKSLIDGTALAGIQKVGTEARTYYYTMTLPWGEGIRILPTKAYLPFAKEMDRLRSKYDEAVRDFLRDYPDHVSQAKVLLNGLFDPNEYPHPDDMARRFSFDIRKSPMPDAADFRVDLGDDVVAMIRSEITDQVNDSVQMAVRDLWERLHAGVARMSERLSTYGRDENGKLNGRIHETLVENLRELVDLLPTLNLTADPGLDRMAREVSERLCRIGAQDLREDDIVRAEVAKDAKAIENEIDAILRNMDGYTGG